MAGYTRQSEASIQPGQDIDAGPLNTEFDAVEAAFDASTGHAHDGTAGNGPKLGLTSLNQISTKKVLGNMSGSTANVAEVTVLDEDNMATNSDTALATQQSIKAYVDGKASGTMATQNANSVAITGGTISGITDLAVADGGTGAGTFTDGGVLIGNGTGAIQATSAGTAGQVLTSNGAGVDPTFQNAAGGFSVGDVLLSATALSSPWIREDGRKISQSTYSALFAKLGHSQSPVRYPWTPVKIADPATLPQNAGVVTWSPDGRYMHIGHNVETTNISAYDWSTGSPVSISPPPGTPDGTIYGLEWSPNGRYLSAHHTADPFLTIWDWSSGSPVKISDAATTPGSLGVGASGWSPNSRYLACTIQLGSPYIFIYDMSTGVPVKLANPATLPTGNAYDAKFSPNGRYLAVAHNTSPYVTIYDWSTGAPVKITNPSTLPTGNANGVGWSPDGRYLAVVHATSPYVTIYDWSTGAPVKITNPATLPTATGYGVSWSPNGMYMVVKNAGQTLTIYDWTSGVPIKITNPATLPTLVNGNCAWSPNGRYLATSTGYSDGRIIIYDGAERPASDFYLRNVPPIGALNSYIKSS